MISKAEILQMARSILKGDGGKMQHPVVEPQREWYIGIGLFVMILVVGGVYTTNKYQYYNNIESTVETSTRTHKVYDQHSAEVALSLFQDRHEKFKDIVETTIQTDDAVETSSTTSGTSTAVSEEDSDESLVPVTDLAPTLAE